MSVGTFVCIAVLSVYDGDTFTARLNGDLPDIFKKISVRIDGVDAPELTSDEPCQKEKALKSKTFLTNTLVKAHCITLEKVSPDKYFRLRAKVIVDGKDVSDILLSKGFAVPYFGGKRASVPCR